MTDEEKFQIAIHTTITEFCDRIGFELIYKSGRYIHPGWHGLSIKGNGEAFKNFSTQDNSDITSGGTIAFVKWLYEIQGKKLSKKEVIDLIVKKMGYDIHDSIKPIDKIKVENKKEIKRESEKKFQLSPRNKNENRVFAYLIKSRKIDADIVRMMVENHLIYETGDQRHNCVFLSYDENKNVVGANLRGTHTPLKGEDPKRYKFHQNIGNDTDYGFIIQGTSNKIRIFESPIDLMSRMTLLKYRDPEKYKKALMDTWISLNGLKDRKIFKVLENNPQIDTLYFSTDNDEAGETFCLKVKEELKNKEPNKYQLFRDKSKFKKDWNEELIFFSEKQNERSIYHTISYKQKNSIQL